jgi:hypothetical protein
VPAIITRRFGGPQAVPRYGVPATLRPRVVRGENWSAGVWLERHGYDGLLEVLHRLDWPVLDGVTLADDGEPIRLTSVPRRAGETLNGFLEPRGAIAVEPAYVPVLALGAVVHEWIHLLVETRRLARLVTTRVARWCCRRPIHGWRRGSRRRGASGCWRPRTRRCRCSPSARPRSARVLRAPRPTTPMCSAT